MKKILLTLSVLLFYLISSSQEEKTKNFTFTGYLSQMNQTIIDSINGNWINDGLIHNRLMFQYYGINNLTFDIEARNRLIYGESVKFTPNYAAYFEKDNGILDLTANIANGNSYILNTTIDRLYLQYELGNFVVTAGRQRINWGKTFVWNPNDLFNNYSFFDFDYAEKPGADAIDLQYFINYASSIEVAAKINSDSNLTTAIKYGFNLKQYDFQTIIGYLDDEDFVAGGGWTGNIKNVTFRGEFSYVQPKKNFLDTSGLFIASIGFDYMFSNSLTIMGEYLYNQNEPTFNLSNLFQIQDAPMNIKSLSFAKHNAVLQVSYPVNPIINVSAAAMWMSKDNWMFFSPNVDFAISQNMNFTFVGQFFYGKMLNPLTMAKEQKLLSLIFFRLKYSF